MVNSYKNDQSLSWKNSLHLVKVAAILSSFICRLFSVVGFILRTTFSKREAEISVLLCTSQLLC